MGSRWRTLLGSVKKSIDAIAVGVAMRVLGVRESAVSTAMCSVTTAAHEAYLDRFH
jgi:putative Mn2+ efflux pump MntP